MERNINDLLKNIDIIKVIEHYLSLTKKNNNYWSLCPFHTDNKPSLSVSTKRQIFKCFSCGVSGNAIFFVMKKENINFNKALSKIEQILNINLNFNNKYKKNTSLENLYLINDLCHKFYKLNVNLYKNEIQSFFKERNIDIDIIKTFEIGFATDKDYENLLNIFKKYNQVYPDKLISILEINHLSIIYKNRCFFRNRIIFPIFNEDKQISGFSGRILNNNNEVKYLNSSESNIFKKNNCLFNINNLEKDNPIYIFEGFLDVMSSYRIGIKNCVCLMSNNISKEQIDLLIKYSKEIIICLDNDEAGFSGTINIFKKLSQKNLNTRIVNFFDLQQKDIDELINFDVEIAKQILNNPISFEKWNLLYLKKKEKEISKNLDHKFKERLLNLLTIWKQYSFFINEKYPNHEEWFFDLKPLLENKKNLEIINLINNFDPKSFCSNYEKELKNHTFFNENLKSFFISYYEFNNDLIIELINLLNLENDFKKRINLKNFYEKSKKKNSELLKKIIILKN